jgi:hypothetical protein
MSNFGYFSLPRSLTRTKIWNDLPLSYHKVFTVLVDHACFNTYKFDDHGRVFDLQPGQYCASYAEIKQLCGKHVEVIDVERAIKKFILYGFVSQEVRYRKSIITITHSDTYNLIIRGCEVNREVNLRQTCGKLEVQSNNINTEENEENNISREALNGKIIGLDFVNENFEQFSSNEKESLKNKPDKKKNNPSELAFSLLDFFYKSLEIHIPTQRSIQKNTQKLTEMARHFDKILKTYSELEIRDCVNYGHSNDFWKNNGIIKNPRKLEEHMGTLLTQLKGKSNEKNQKNPISDESQYDLSDIDPFLKKRAIELQKEFEKIQKQAKNNE